MTNILSLPNSYWSCLLAIIISIGITIDSPTTAEAKTPSNAELYEMVKALQGKVAALESENRSLRARVPVEQSPTPVERASIGRNVVDSDPDATAHDTWSGLYVGASFAAGKTSAKASREFGVDSVNSSAGFAFIGRRETGHGAIVDLFMGINKQIGRQFVIGAQIEGGVSNIDFRSNGVNVTTRGNTSNTFEDVVKVEAEWSVSALGRAGLLVSPSTLLYGIGGWTYAHLNTDDGLRELDGVSFGLHGLSAGGGIERKIGSDWSIRGEYRYTRFLKDGIDADTFSFGTSVPLTTNTARAEFENEMHFGRIGFTRYVNGGD